METPIRKILFVCTSGKDRSKACVDIFENFAPENKYLCCGINNFFTMKHNTLLVSSTLLDWATDIVFMEDHHKKTTIERHGNANESKMKVLHLGNWDFQMSGVSYSPSYAIKMTTTLLNKVNDLIKIK